MDHPKKYAILYLDPSKPEGEDLWFYEGGGPEDEWVELTVRMPRSWLEAPADGVQAVIEENPFSNRYVWRNCDYYPRVPNGEVCSTDDLGPHLRAYAPWIKHGLCGTEEQYVRAIDLAREYTAIPKHPDEGAPPRRPRPDEDL